jgi:uncharacterized membrane protein YadS
MANEGGLRFRTWEDLIIFIIVVIAMNAKLVFSNFQFFSDPPVDRAWVAILMGAIVSILAYLPFRFLLKDRFTNSQILSTTVLLGVLVTHETVFKLEDHFSTVSIMALFIFIFYFIVDDGTTTSLRTAAPL